jgi:CheY-like chemotaxis protein
MVMPLDQRRGKADLGRGTVLVVDDDVTHTNVASALILAIGYDVIVANDGEEAVREYLEHGHEIVLVLMDIAMPKLGGIKATTMIRRIDPAAKVILSGGIWEYFPADLTEANANAFLPKPYTYADLRIIFQHVLHRQHPAQPYHPVGESIQDGGSRLEATLNR